MKTFFASLLALAFACTGAHAGPRCGQTARGTIFPRLRAAFEFAPIRTAIAQTASLPSRIAEARPVVNTVKNVAGCFNGICPTK